MDHAKHTQLAQEEKDAAKQFATEQNEILNSLPLEKHFSDFSVQERRQFMRLTPANIRKFNLRQQRYQKEHFE